MTETAPTIQASEFDSKISDLDRKIEKSEKALNQWKSDRDALVRAKSLICGTGSTTETKKDDEREIILAVLGEGPMYYKDITTKLNDRLSLSKKVETVYAKLDRMSKEEDPVIVKVGDGKFALPNKQDEAEGIAGGTGVAIATP
jgi:hypothetical protein